MAKTPSKMAPPKAVKKKRAPTKKTAIGWKGQAVNANMQKAMQERHANAVATGDLTNGLLRTQEANRTITKGSIFRNVHNRANNVSGTLGDLCMEFGEGQTRKNDSNIIVATDLETVVDSFKNIKGDKVFKATTNKSATAVFLTKMSKLCKIIERPNLLKGDKKIKPGMRFVFQHPLFYPGAPSEELDKVFASDKKIPCNCNIVDYP